METIEHKSPPLEEILERITDAFIALDKNWRFTIINKKAGEVFKLDPIGMIGKNIWTDLPKDITQIIDTAYHGAMAEQNHLFLELYFPTLDKWFENHIYPSPNGLTLYFRCITDRKKHEQLIHKSEEQFRRVVEHIHDALMVDDVQGNVIYANEQFFNLFGFKNTDLGSIRLEDYIAPDYRKQLRERHERRIRGEAVESHFEYQGIRTDGKHLWLEADVTIMIGKDGTIIGTQSAIRDITERNRAENELIKSEEKYRTLVEQASDAIFVSDPETNIIDVNSRGCQMLGYTKEELLKLKAPDIIYIIPGEPPLQIDRLMAGETVSIRRNGKRKDGSLFPVEMTSRMLPDGRFLGMVRDITKRLMAEEELKASEAKYRNVVENIHEALMIDDIEGNLIYVNSEFCKIFGYTQDEFKKLSITDYTSPESYPEVIARHHQRMKGIKVPEEYEYKGVRKDGTVIWLEARVSLVIEKGEIVGTQSLERDITERKKAEEETKKITDQLSEISSSIPGAVYQFKLSTDGTMTFPFISKGLYELSGLTPEEVYQDSHIPFSIIHEEDLPGVYKSIETSAQTMEPWSNIFRIKSRDGQSKWIRGNSIPHKLSEGDILWNGTLFDISELKNKEQELGTSELRFRSLVEQASDGIFLSTPKGYLIDANSMGCRMLGYTKDEIINQKISNIILVPDNEPPLQFERVAAGEHVLMTRMVRKKDGSQFPVEINSKMLADGRFLGIVRDITERKNAEEKIFQKEVQYRTLVEHASDGIFITDLNENFLDANSSACELTGYSKEELLRMAIDDLLVIKPGDTPSRLDEIKQGVRIVQERNMKCKNGSMVPIEVTAKMLPDKRVLSMVRDVSERKKVALKLYESEKRYRSIFESSGEGILLTNTDGTVLSANPEACKILGMTEEEICSLGRNGIVNLKDPRLAAAIETRKKHGKFKGELTLVRKDGTIFPADINTTVFTTSTGEERTSMFINDITSRKKTEDEIRDSEEKFRSVIENTSDGFVLYDVQTKKVIETNSAYEKMLGYKPGEMKNLTLYDNVAHEKEDVDRFFERIKKQKNFFIGNRKHRKKDGTTIDVEVTVNNLLIRNKDVMSVLVRDITERKKAEEKLLESEMRYRHLIESTHDLVQSVGPSGEFILVNNAWVETLGYNESDRAELRLFDIIHPDSQKHCRELFSHVLVGEPLKSFEAIFLKKNGDSVILEGSAEPRILNGEIIATQSFFRDITERKKQRKKY